MTTAATENPQTQTAAASPEPTQSIAMRDATLGAFSMLKDVEVEITVEIGRRRMRIAEVLKLASGQTLELSKAAGEPLDIYVNGKLLGHGEAVVLGDRYGIRITELVANSDGESK